MDLQILPNPGDTDTLDRLAITLDELRELRDLVRVIGFEIKFRILTPEAAAGAAHGG